MPVIQGTAVASFNNAAPITLQGEWNLSHGVPSFRAYGQGNGKPGGGYIGAALGTKQDVSGTFTFVVDADASLVDAFVLAGQAGFFTLDWTIGDPDISQRKAKCIDCHFDKIEHRVNNPDGSYLIQCQMSAGKTDNLLI